MTDEELTLAIKRLCDSVDGLRREVELGREHTSFLYQEVLNLTRATDQLKAEMR